MRSAALMVVYWSSQMRPLSYSATACARSAASCWYWARITFSWSYAIHLLLVMLSVGCRRRCWQRAELVEVELEGRAIVIALTEHAVRLQRIERGELLRRRPKLDVMRKFPLS